MQFKGNRLALGSRLKAVGIVIVLFSVVSGCGYTTKTLLPEGVRTVHVAIFTNSIDITKEISDKDKYELKQSTGT